MYHQYHVANEGYLIPKLASLKDEVTLNELCCIDISAWNHLTAKASEQLQSETARGIQTMTNISKYVETNFDWANRAVLEKYDLEPAVPITIQHIMAMMLYCNYDVCTQCMFLRNSM